MKIEDLKNTKIYLKTEDEAKRFKEKAFALGAKWNVGGAEDFIHFTFYYISSDLKITAGTNGCPNLFIESKNKQIFLEDVLAIEEPSVLVAGTPVLVRDEDGEEWKYNIFSRLNPKHDKGYPLYICLAPAYRQCIPYEGNQHLLGTEE